MEEEHTKRTDQRTEQSFLLGEPTSLHRPRSSVFVYLSVCTDCQQHLLETSLWGSCPRSATLSYCHSGLLHFFKLWYKNVCARSEINNPHKYPYILYINFLLGMSFVAGKGTIWLNPDVQVGILM